MENMKITEMYENLPKIIKILLQVFLGCSISGVYRILRFLETKNVVTLVAGLVGLFIGFCNAISWFNAISWLNAIIWLIDLYTQITKNRITFLAD